DEFEPDMPPVYGAGHLLGDLFNPGEVGVQMAAGMGAVAIDHDAIRAWMENTGARRGAWECRFLVRLSQDYTAESNKATKRDRKPPWKAPDAKPEKTALQLSIRNFIN